MKHIELKTSSACWLRSWSSIDRIRDYYWLELLFTCVPLRLRLSVVYCNWRHLPSSSNRTTWVSCGRCLVISCRPSSTMSNSSRDGLTSPQRLLRAVESAQTFFRRLKSYMASWSPSCSDVWRSTWRKICLWRKNSESFIAIQVGNQSLTNGWLNE